MLVKPEIPTANRDEDIGVQSSIVSIYIKNSKHLTKEHNHYEEGQRRAKATQKS